MLLQLRDNTKLGAPVFSLQVRRDNMTPPATLQKKKANSTVQMPQLAHFDVYGIRDIGRAELTILTKGYERKALVQRKCCMSLS